MSEIKVGELITDNQSRDAIHCAVAPVIAVHAMVPGQHIGFENPNNTERVSLLADKKIGIVLVNYASQHC